MGSSASRPARKLTKTIVNTDKILRSSKAQLPPKALREQFENSQAQETTPEASQQQSPNTFEQPRGNDRGSQNLAPHSTPNTQFANHPPGKDGMDPTADQAFIDSISKLGRQIRSEEAKSPNSQLNVRALKQLLNRKALYEKGQKEVKDQLDPELVHLRTMIHPKTLLSILLAFHDEGITKETVLKDYELSPEFLENLSRFKVAQNVVAIEEDTKEDEVGPKISKDRVRAPETDERDSEGDFENERLKMLRKRLE